MRRRIKKLYRFRILICLLLLVIVFLISFSVYIFSVQRSHVMRIMQNYNDSVLSTIDNRLRTGDEITRKMLTEIVSKPCATRIMYSPDNDPDREAMDHQELSYEIGLIPDIESAVSYNNKTNCFKYYLRGDMPDEVMQNIIYKGKETVPYLPYINNAGKYDKKNMSYITYYAFDYLVGNVMNGVIVVELGTDWIDTMVSSHSDAVNIIICDKAGKIVYSHNNKSLYGEGIGDSYRFLLESGTDGIYPIRDEGQKNYVSVKRIMNGNYIAICEQSPAAVFTGYIRQVWTNLIVMIMILLTLGIIGAGALARYISAPVKKLATYLQNGSKDSMSDSEVFEKISEILERREDNNIQMEEMRRLIDDVKQQNILKTLMYGQEPEQNEDSTELKRFFDDADIIGIEMLFSEALDVNAVRTLCRSVFDGFAEYKFVSAEYSNFILLLKMDEKLNDSIRPLVNYLQKRAEIELHRKASVFISAEYKFGELDELYTELASVRKYELLYGRGCVLDREIISRYNSSGDAEYPRNEANKLLKAVIDKDLNATQQLFDDFLEKIISLSINDFRTALMRLAFDIQASFENASCKADGSYDRVAALVKQAAGYQTMNDVYVSFTELFSFCCDTTKQSRNEYSTIVNSVLECIDSYYPEPGLNVDFISDKLDLSPNYVRKMFKAELGVSVTQYLTEYRLKKSVEYLKSDMSIKNIIEKTGFASESNFYKQFKKHYGITPSDYRSVT